MLSPSDSARRCVQIHAIEGIEEVGTELELYPLGEDKVLLHAQIDIPIARPTNRPLRRTVAEGARPQVPV